MNNRPTLVALVCCGVLASAYVLAQTITQGKKYPLSITVTVIDDEGAPIDGCEVKTSTYTRFQPGQGFGKEIWEGSNAVTDDEGKVSFEYESQNGAIRYSAITPSGYYATEAQEYQFDPVKKDMWQPENQSLQIVLKPIVNPIPLYARRAGKSYRNPLALPDLDRPIGFDLIKYDWVAPYGDGETSDFLFELNRRFVTVEDFTATLNVTFPRPGDGIQEHIAHPHKGSRLRLPRYAPEDGYQPHLTRTKTPNPKDTTETRVTKDRNYLFRVRTILDSQGNVVSAHYGKIHGDIVPDIVNDEKGFIFFEYYFNPTQNDRNLEFDPKRNLFDNLPSSERVNNP